MNTRLRADSAAALMDMAAKGTMKDPPVLDAPQGELREVITSGGPARLAIVRVTPAPGLSARQPA